MASETLAKIDRAYDVVGALCEGKREWLMSIPARPDHDPDLIIGDALLAARNEISRLTRELEEAREIIRDLVDREPICVALRSKYVEVRIDGWTWDDARRFVGLDPAGDDETM